ncbi:HAMP domain-containing protein [Rhizobium sp. XQZ8]|uniref:ATP-binding protein n=1 Tax=Rhizobium populisoli TaxID=2859785 RepID=UPI001CA5798B|nr:ATP-binding protein [Rhizobium populisoli]MBW6424208.1 HAMP domain-containing protein [Rhizobium populisoli]
MRLRWPAFQLTIHSQITIIIVICLIIVIVGSERLEQWVKQDYDITDLEAISNRVAAIASVLAVARPSEIDDVIEIANRADWHVALAPLETANRFTTTSPNQSYLDRFADWLSPPDSYTAPYGGWQTFLDGHRVVAARIGKSDLLVMERLPDTFVSSDALTFGSNYLFALITLIVIFSTFAIWTITRPLRRIAAAAMRADISSGPTLFPEQGSLEIVALARALNGMQNRISGMVEARTAMLRGISHDLRTPLTRMRLRADRVSETDVRQALLVDIGHVDKLLEESLNYLRDSHRSEKPERVDLASVIKTICAEFEDTGHNITYSGPDRLVMNFRPLAIMRAVTNLCENASKFGTQIDVSLSVNGGFAIIDVEDNGPGIPLELRKKVLEPFYKVDASRNSQNAGFGLGLSIVTEVVQSHQGRLELLDRSPNGLIARIMLPMGD